MILPVDRLLTTPFPRLGEGPLRPVKVAVLDTGIDATHPALRGRVVGVDGKRLKANNDPSGHGTAVASIVAAIAPNARIVDYRVLDADNRGYGASVVDGLAAAVESDADIINLSVSIRKDVHWERTVKLLERAYVRNKIVVAAERNVPRPDDAGMPAELSGTIGVGAGDYVNPYVLKFLAGSPIEFSAHGDAVLVARSGGGYVRMSGTSFATAAVSGLCALLRGCNAGLTSFELKTILRYHAQHPEMESGADNVLEVLPDIRGARYQRVPYACPGCGRRFEVSDAFSKVKCPFCGRVGRRKVLLDPQLYYRILGELRESIPPEYVFHNWEHARDTVEAVYRLLPRHPGLTLRECRCLLLAALLHDCAYSEGRNGHEARSARVAGEIYAASGMADRDVRLIRELILATELEREPRTPCERLIREADIFGVGTRKGALRARLIRQELANLGTAYTDAEWARLNRAFVKRHGRKGGK